MTSLIVSSAYCAHFLLSNLPAKPEEEAQRHRQEYDEMVAEAKRRGNDRSAETQSHRRISRVQNIHEMKQICECVQCLDYWTFNLLLNSYPL